MFWGQGVIPKNFQLCRMHPNGLSFHLVPHTLGVLFWIYFRLWGVRGTVILICQYTNATIFDPNKIFIWEIWNQSQTISSKDENRRCPNGMDSDITEGPP